MLPQRSQHGGDEDGQQDEAGVAAGDVPASDKEHERDEHRRIRHGEQPGARDGSSSRQMRQA